MPEWLSALLHNRLLGLGSVALIIVAGVLHGMGQGVERRGGPPEKAARLQKLGVLLFIVGAVLLIFTGPFKFWERP